MGPTALAVETLDPTTRAEWEELRCLAHRMVDDVIDLHQGIRERPTWRPVPESAREALSGALPGAGEDPRRSYEIFREHVLPNYLGNIHPRTWSWVNGTGSTLGALADLLASAMNPNCAGARHGALYVELQVLETLKAALGWPRAGSGLLTSGASMATVIGLAAARDWAVGRDQVGRRGLRATPEQLVLYTSHEAHNSIDRAVRLLGIGSDYLRRIPVDRHGRMIPGALRVTIATDRAEGLHPFAVVATAGTVDRGAVDPLEELSRICREHELWLHVDGAFGAVAALSDELRPLVAGMSRADSLAFDLHKWLHVPIDTGCVLVRNDEAHRAPFSVPASYLRPLKRGVTPPEHWLAEYGPELTRSFRALRAWFTLRVFGIDKLGALVLRNVRQTRHAEALIRAEPRLELLAAGPLCVLCFRYNPCGLDDPSLDALNEEILGDVQESGFAQPSSTMVGGVFALRIAVTNHRTRFDDLDAFLATVVELGDRRTRRARG